MMKNIVLFASGSGTNAENIILHFRQKESAKVVAVFSNNPDAKVLDRAAKLDVPTFVFSKADLLSGAILLQLKGLQTDMIVLAGFLLKFPADIVEAYPDKIINIHPALLPKYGGKGMYGMHVHHAIFENRDVITGITIHYVNENYDEGNIIFQETVSIEDCQSPEEIAFKIHELEQQHFPIVIEEILNLKSKI